MYISSGNSESGKQISQNVRKLRPRFPERTETPEPENLESGEIWQFVQNVRKLRLWCKTVWKLRARVSGVNGPDGPVAMCPGSIDPKRTETPMSCCGLGARRSAVPCVAGNPGSRNQPPPKGLALWCSGGMDPETIFHTSENQNPMGHFHFSKFFKIRVQSFRTTPAPYARSSRWDTMTPLST